MDKKWRSKEVNKLMVVKMFKMMKKTTSERIIEVMVALKDAELFYDKNIKDRITKTSVSWRSDHPSVIHYMNKEKLLYDIRFELEEYLTELIKKKENEKTNSI